MFFSEWFQTRQLALSWREPARAHATILAMYSDIEERMWRRARI